jgi:hypothetical protein
VRRAQRSWLLLLSVAATVAHAQASSADANAPAATPPVATPQEIARCAGRNDDAARLACYDGLFRATPKTVEAGFGLERREARLDGALATIASPITAVERMRDGTVRVTLENGQVWRQVDGSRQALWRTGDRLLVERASLGSFLAAVEGSSRYVRVRREQ